MKSVHTNVLTFNFYSSIKAKECGEILEERGGTCVKLNVQKGRGKISFRSSFYPISFLLSLSPLPHSFPFLMPFLIPLSSLSPAHSLSFSWPLPTFYYLSYPHPSRLPFPFSAHFPFPVPHFLSTFPSPFLSFHFPLLFPFILSFTLFYIISFSPPLSHFTFFSLSLPFPIPSPLSFPPLYPTYISLSPFLFPIPVPFYFHPLFLPFHFPLSLSVFLFSVPFTFRFPLDLTPFPFLFPLSWMKIERDTQGFLSTLKPGATDGGLNSMKSWKQLY